MERQIKPLPKKPWTELTQKEQQVIRKSWKHHLPDVFDVFCIGDLRIFGDDCIVPGNLYISGDAETWDVNIGSNFIVEGSADTGYVNVGGNFIVGGDTDTDYVDVGGDFIVGGSAKTWDVNVGGNFNVGGSANTGDVDVVGDFIVEGSADTCVVKVYGLFECNDIVSHNCPIHAADFVCRCYEEKNT